MKQLFKSIKLRAGLIGQWILTKLGRKKPVEVDRPIITPEEKRDNAVKDYAEGLKHNFASQLETLLSDEDFLRFVMDSYQQRGVQNSHHLTEEYIRIFYNDLAEEYSKMLWYLSNVSGVLLHEFNIDNQDMLNVDGKVPVNAYGLCFNETITSNNEKGLTLEIQQATVEAKAVTFPFMDFTKFAFAPHILDLKKALVENTFGHIVEQLLEELISNSPEEVLKKTERHDLDENIIQICEINIIANQIAMNSKRGAGNVMIVSPNDIEKLRSVLNEAGTKRIEDHFNSLGFRSEYLQYEFTLGNGIRIFSSSLFQQKMEKLKPESDLNCAMLWAGGASATVSDAPTTISIVELANWIPWKTISADDLSSSYRWKDMKDAGVALYKVRDAYSVVATDNAFKTCMIPHGRALLTQLRSLKENSND